MACVILPLDTNCDPSSGGIKVSYITDIENITSVTWDVNNQVTGITMEDTDLWAKFVYENNDTAFYNQVGARANNGKKHPYTQTAFMQFEGLTNAKRAAVEALVECCKLVAIHFTTNGTAMIQGIKKVAGGGLFEETNKPAKMTALFNTDTSANADRVEFQLISEDNKLSPFTTLSKAAIEAL